MATQYVFDKNDVATETGIRKSLRSRRLATRIPGKNSGQAGSGCASQSCFLCSTNILINLDRLLKGKVSSKGLEKQIAIF